MPSPPAGLWSDLHPELPVALVPVRLETRFGTRVEQAPGAEVSIPVLRVRIYPDDLSVVASSPGLNTVEKEAGADFWSAQDAPETAEEAALPGALDLRRRGAWEVLSRRVGPARTAFVADATRPGAPPAPDRAEEPATARLLPDAWVVTGYLDGQQVFAEHVTRAAADLQVGPSRDTGKPAFAPGDPRLVDPDDGLRWTTDFDAAVAIGMAAVIDLATIQQVQSGAVTAAVTRGLDTVVVVGARAPGAERTADTEAAMFADLLTAHAASDRVGFVAQGTPTNNLIDQPSGWSGSGDVFAGYDQVVGAAAEPAPFSDVSALRGGTADGLAFETALGLPGGLTAGLDGATGNEQWLARNMALALFPATIGEVVGTLARPDSLTGIVNQASIDRYLDQLDTVLPFVREHVGAFVRGRGPLPVLRIGRQPYGVLPILAPTQWRPTQQEPAHLARLHDVLGVARSFFEPAAESIPAMTEGADATTELVRILGLSPVPHPGGYTVRDVTGQLAGVFVMMSAPPPVAVRSGEGGAEIVRTIATSGMLDDAIALPAYRHLMALTLGDLIDGTQMEWLALNGIKPMRASVAVTDKTRSGWESPPTYLSRLTHEMIDFRLAGLKQAERRPTDLLFLLAEHALALAGELDTLRILSAVNSDHFRAAVAVSTEVSDSTLPVAEAFTSASTSTASQLAGPRSRLPRETIPALVSNDAKRADLLVALNLPPEHVNGFAGTRDAVRALAAAGLSDADYTRLTSETLACASTRLDAWYTSLASQRLEVQRAATPAGLQLGAWGVLVDVRPQAGSPVVADELPTGWVGSAGQSVTPDPLVHPARQVGYVHAPSLAQARTAGVLRAGEVAHAGDGSTLASLDLTSRRVRTGREIVDALGNGQPLGAVLGYRLERMLADRTLYAEIAALRAAFPQRRVGGAEGTVAAGTDTVVPDEVVDGFEVWQNRAQAATVCHDLGHDAALQEVIAELDVVVEGVADLLVAEGVHQITSGRPESGGATFTAVAEGTAPPELDVAREPRSGITITHRTLVVLDPDAGTPGWNRSAPRALLAPEAERWAEDVLGPAAGWHLAVGATQVGLGELDVCALDVLVEARAGAAAAPPLAERLLAAQADAAAVIDDPGYVRLLSLAQAAGEVLAGARPAVPADLVLPDQATSPDAGTVLATAAPAAAALLPIADRTSTQLDALLTAIDAVATAAQGLDPTTPVDSALLTPFRALGLPGSVRASAQVPVSDVVASASAAAAVLRDVDQLIATGLPDPPPGATTRTARLQAVCAAPHALDTLVAVVRRLAGQAVVPALEVDSGLGAGHVAGPDADAVEGWLSRMGRVRSKLAAYDDLRLFLEAEGQELPPLQAFQLPLVADEGWLADELPAAPGGNELRAWKRPDGPRAHVVAAGPTDLLTAATATALVVDEVSEVLPSPTVSTGVAAHFDAPSARPPQTILLAVHPDPTQPWGWELLAETAQEALALAKLRAVELDDLAGSGIDEYLPLTYVRDGLDHTSPLTDLTKGLQLLEETVAANRYLEVNH